MTPTGVCHCWRRSRSGPLRVRWSDATEEDHEEADPGAALIAANKRPGGQAQALRHLSNVMATGRDPLRYVDTDQLSRTIRLGRRFDEFAAMVRPDYGKDGWVTGNDDDNKHWFAYRVDRKSLLMHVVLVQDIQDIDPVRALAGYCATELFSKHSHDVQSCKVLAQTADSGFWHQLRDASDDVVQVDLVNALDEPLGAVMAMMRSQPNGSTEFPDVQIPPCSRPSRAQSQKQCMTFSPLPGGSVRMHVAIATPLGDQKTTLEMERMSKAAVTKVIKPLISTWPTRFEAFLQGHREQLVHGEAFSPHAPFFAVCRGYLSGRAGPRRASLRQWRVLSKGFPRSWDGGD
mmetsp:Transcript_53073/g.119602  ORF Transcript_53073/g.119602 Transcript_53073/m.119602 type:complete len:346 (+) Transcript_53073:66-1103(+)